MLSRSVAKFAGFEGLKVLLTTTRSARHCLLLLQNYCGLKDRQTSWSFDCKNPGLLGIRLQSLDQAQSSLNLSLGISKLQSFAGGGERECTRLCDSKTIRSALQAFSRTSRKSEGSSCSTTNVGSTVPEVLRPLSRNRCPQSSRH